MNLNFGFTFQDLYSYDGLLKLNKKFLTYLEDYEQNLYDLVNRSEFNNADLIIELSYVLERFIVELFGIPTIIKSLKVRYDDFLILYRCKRLFVQRYALKKYNNSINLDVDMIQGKIAKFFCFPIDEYAFAKKVMMWYKKKDQYQEELEVASQYSVYRVFSNCQDSILFNFPKKIDYTNLVPIEKSNIDGLEVLKGKNVHHRVGFDFKEVEHKFERGLNNAHYCIFCHKQNRDSCSKGLFDENNQVKYSALQNELYGCPLREKISEMNLVKSQGFIIASLAIIMIDNPLCVLTGHRICNDCTKSCIYQKQDPVDIPLVESMVIDDVLKLPYGFEIYSLLTRWNPLNFLRPLPLADTNKNVLVVGLGPAGISLAYNLLNDGHNVIAIDALKIEPVQENISSVNQRGQRIDFYPIKDVHKELYEKLSQRKAYGFGGVAEYGITVRWNKNYLSIARLILERRKNFAMYGGIRFGSTISASNAFNLGFQHIALALGSGKPAILFGVKNWLVRGVRMASDFLMSLQSTGAFRQDLVSNLQIRLPIVVIGGGLTAIDCATEALAYYQVQVEKFLLYYEILVVKHGKSWVENSWNEEERIIAQEFLSHAGKIRAEKALAVVEGRKEKLCELLQSLGGVKIVYRKNINSAPSYKLNSDEIQYALSEGVYFIENLNLYEVMTDKYNHIKSIKCKDQNNSERLLEAKTMIVAIGTEQNNTIFHDQYSDNECSNIFAKDNYSKSLSNDNIFLYKDNQKAISVFGDLHPSYNGSVVKAIASAKNGYPMISNLLSNYEEVQNNSYDFFNKINYLFSSYIVSIRYLSSKIIELIIKSPLAARNFRPGQFYRLQNFEANSVKVQNELNTKLMMEGIAATGVSVNKEQGLISVIILNTGGSSSICCMLKENEPIVLMGPTGHPTKIPKKKNIMLIGGGVGNSVLFSIGQAMINNECNVLYFAGYREYNDIFSKSSVEMSGNIVVWCCEEKKIDSRRNQDKSFHGNIIEAMLSYHNGDLGKCDINFKDIDRVLIVGSSKMMQVVSSSIQNELKYFFKDNISLIASINSPMQCMMKEVCAQCLQRHIDPISGEESFVYSCVNQDQDLKYVDFNFLNERLRQNSLQEKITCKWLDYCFNH